LSDFIKWPGDDVIFLCLYPASNFVLDLFQAGDENGLIKPLQSNQVKRTPQDYLNEMIIGKLNPVHVPRIRGMG